MSIILRDCKVMKKSQALPELFNLEFDDSNLPADVNLLRVKDALKKINFKGKATEDRKVLGPIRKRLVTTR